MTDESTVQITTTKPDPLLALRVASPNTRILAPEAYVGKQIDIQGTLHRAVHGDEEVPQQSLTLEANDDYWGGAVTIDTAEVRFVSNGAVRATRLQTGESQISMGIPAANLPSMESDAYLRIDKPEGPRTTVMLLNNSRPPFDDPLVRRAIQHAVDTRAIVDSIYEGTAEPAVGPFAPGTRWAAADAQPATVDLDEARSLPDQAGVAPGSLSIDLMAYTDKPEFPDVAAALQDQLGELGIEVEIRAAQYAALEPEMLSGNSDAALMSRGYLIDVADPAAYMLSDWTCDGRFNIACYCDPASDRMIHDAGTLDDADSRNEVYAQNAAKLQSDAASVFLLHEGAAWGVRSDVEGFQPHPLDHYVLTAALAVGS